MKQYVPQTTKIDIGFMIEEKTDYLHGEPEYDQAMNYVNTALRTYLKATYPNKKKKTKKVTINGESLKITRRSDADAINSIRYEIIHAYKEDNRPFDPNDPSTFEEQEIKYISSIGIHLKSKNGELLNSVEAIDNVVEKALLTIK